MFPQSTTIFFSLWRAQKSSKRLMLSLRPIMGFASYESWAHAASSLRNVLHASGILFGSIGFKLISRILFLWYVKAFRRGVFRDASTPLRIDLYIACANLKASLRARGSPRHGSGAKNRSRNIPWGSANGTERLVGLQWKARYRVM